MTLRAFVSAPPLAIAAIQLAALATLSTGCDAFRSAPARTIVVLPDVSGTIPAADSALYRDAFSVIVRSLRPGDRLVVARIGDQSRTNFRLDFDINIPNTEIELDDIEARDSLARVATAAFDDLLRRDGAAQSRILDALAIAGEVFERDHTRPGRVVVALSDMLLEGPTVNLRTRPVDSVLTGHVIEERRQSGTLPSLHGASVYVVGAGGSVRDEEKYYRVRDFWLRVLQASGATIDVTMYGRTSLNAIP